MRRGVGKEIKIAFWFTLAFLLGGIIHFSLYYVEWADCISQIYYLALVTAWTISIRYRIVDRKVRRLLLATAVLFLLSIFLQMFRYRIFCQLETAKRYFWYGYYFPILFVPILFLFVCLRLKLEENEKLDRRWLLMLIPSAVLFLLVMTNDLHQIIFIFPEGSSGVTGTYTHGMTFYLIYVWVILVFGLAIFFAVKSCRVPNAGGRLFMPLYFSLYGILSIFAMLDLPKVNGVTVWFFVECHAMVTIGLAESCIQLGLIPSNSSYRTVFRHADKPVVISDLSGTPVYSSPSAERLFMRGEPVQVHTQPISGGSVSWAIDLTEITELNRGIESAAESIKSRNDYLRTENALKEEQSGLEARNALYNKIAYIVTPQLETVKAILHRENGTVSDVDLAKIAVLDAYIKRRSNMELLRSDEKNFPVGELSAAVRESCEYLKLCGVTAVLNETGASLPADAQIVLYEAFEAVTEGCLDSLRFLLINVDNGENGAVMRLLLNAPGTDPACLRDMLPAGVGFSASSDQDADEVTVLMTVCEGREKE
ncbi:MAG: hypothetical protein MJ070_01620 [Lachnospiraceae bacterium]|nr:hypothetical protein [Lachnospiraceae bacterium]